MTADGDQVLQLTGKLGSVRSRDGDLRATARVLFAGKPVKGLRFSREALEASITDWIGNTVSLGAHNSQPRPDWSQDARNPVVGKIRSGYVDDEGALCFPTSFDQRRLKPALAKHDLERLEDLPGEVSVDCVVRRLEGPDEDGITDCALQYTQGYVLLADELGACSRADGCGLQLSASATCCAECAAKEANMAEKKPAAITEESLSEALATALGPLSESLQANAAAIKELQAAQKEAQAPKGKGKDGGAGDGTDESAEVVDLKKRAEAAEAKAAKLEKAAKADVIEGLVETDHYGEDDREKLSAIDLDELTERLRLLSPVEEEQTDEERVAASKGKAGQEFSFKGRRKAAPGANAGKPKGKDDDDEPKAPPSWEEQCAQMWNRTGNGRGQEATN